MGGTAGVGDGDDTYVKIKTAGSVGANGVYMRLRDTMWSGQGGAGFNVLRLRLFDLFRRMIVTPKQQIILLCL